MPAGEEQCLGSNGGGDGSGERGGGGRGGEREE